MIKISNLFLLFILSSYLNQIRGMNGETTQMPYEMILNIIHKKLIEAIKNDDHNRIKGIFEKTKNSKIDLNKKFGPENQPLLNYFINNYVHKPEDIKLKVIEYLIQNGTQLNNIHFIAPLISSDKLTTLEGIIAFMNMITIWEDENDLKLYYQLIALLLGYGQNITHKAIALATEGKYSNKLLKILNSHQEIINQAKTNPTKELLQETINSNKPCVVQLIVENNPELVTPEDIVLAEQTSPFSVQFLKQALAIQNLGN